MVHRLLSFGVAVLLSSCAAQRPAAVAAPVATVPPPRVTFEQFQRVLSPRSGVMPLSGGEASLVAFALPGDAYSKVYRLDHASRKLTAVYDAGRNLSGLQRDDTGRNFYVLVDRDGDENTEIFALDAEQGAVRKVFGHPGARAHLADFSMDGKRLYVLSNHEKKETFRPYRVEVATGAVEALTDGATNYDDLVVDQAERYVAMLRMFGNNEQHIDVLDLKTRKARTVLARANTVYEPRFFHPSEPFLHVNTDQDSDRSGCARIRVDTPGELEWVRRDPKRDLSCGYKRADKLSTVVESYDGRVEVRIFEGVLGKELPLPVPEKSLVSDNAVIPGTRRAVLRISRANQPGEFFVVDLDAGKSGGLTQISDFNGSGLTSEQFASSYDLRYPSFDGLEIHGVVYAREAWTKSSQKRPVILWPHGGPDDHEWHVFHPIFQYWALNGYVVFAPNFRGSDGYGKKFETLNDGDWGGGHIKDLIWGKRALAQLPYVDPDRVYIVGASFGGFSTLSAITQYPDEFQGAVAIVALANLFTFMESIPKDPAWQSEFLREIGDPVKDRAFYEERSPYFHAAKIRTPLKVYQAENDIRTVKAEMDAFVAKAREQGIPVEYEVLEKEGHGIGRTESWQKLLQGTIEFLERQHRPAASAP